MKRSNKVLPEKLDYAQKRAMMYLPVWNEYDGDLEKCKSCQKVHPPGRGFCNASGDKLRDAGMQKAVDNAEDKHPSWSDCALSLLVQYPNDEFMAEQVREFARNRGLPDPPSKRAWGAIIAKAKKMGIIIHVRYDRVSNPKAHRTPASVWRILYRHTPPAQAEEQFCDWPGRRPRGKEY